MRGARMLTFGTLASGVLAYAFNALAARTLGVDEYGPIAVLWASLFLLTVTLFRPIEQTLSRSLADRLARDEDGLPVLRRLTVIVLVVTAGALAVLGLLWGTATTRLFAGDDLLTLALAAGLAGYALSFLVRGLLGGTRAFEGYGELLLADGGVRIALALPLIAVASTSIAAFAIVAAAYAGALVPLVAASGRRARQEVRRRHSGVDAPAPFHAREALAFAAPAAVIAACDQVLVSGGPLLVALGGGTDAIAAAGTVFAATMLVRAPVFLFQGCAAALLPSLTRLQALGDVAAFRRWLTRAAAILVAFGVAVTAAAALVGSASMHAIYGADFVASRADITILAAGVSCYLAAATFSQALLARGRAGVAAAAWTAVAVVFVAMELGLSGSPLHRVSVAFAVAALLAVTVFALLAAHTARAFAAAPAPASVERPAPKLAPVPEPSPRPLLIVCSSGGHLLQMLELEGAWGDFPRVWVTFDKSDAASLLRGEDVIHAYGPTNRNVPNLVRNVGLAVRVLRSARPAAILTTGAGVAVPFAWVGRALGIRTVYVESFTRIDELSLSARLIAPVARRIYAQWPELAARAPHAQFAGNLFAERTTP